MAQPNRAWALRTFAQLSSLLSSLRVNLVLVNSRARMAGFEDPSNAYITLWDIFTLSGVVGELKITCQLKVTTLIAFSDQDIDDSRGSILIKIDDESGPTPIFLCLQRNHQCNWETSIGGGCCGDPELTTKELNTSVLSRIHSAFSYEGGNDRKAVECVKQWVLAIQKARKRSPSL